MTVRFLAFILSLPLLGCPSSSAPTPPAPPALTCLAAPATTVAILRGDLGKPYLVMFQPAPPRWRLCGSIPPGTEVVAKSGGLWLEGKPTRVGEYRFWIASQ